MNDPKPRGRPPFVPDDAMRARIVLRRGAGWSEADCAAELGISVPTLVKHFRHELDTGRLAARGRALDMLAESAEKGNVSARKALVQLMMAPDRAGAADRLPAGKKARAQIAARTAGDGTAWDGDLIPEPFRDRPN